jgi:CheY-like chemotaxis protein
MRLKGKKLKPKLALVEDNPDNRLLVQAILDEMFDIDEYENGRLALEGITANPPDLILLDISLPEIDGVEVLQRLRKDPAMSKIPAIALTAHAMAGDKEALLSQGFNGYVEKPIMDETVLIQAIQEQLKSR